MLVGPHGRERQSPATGRRLSAGLDYYKPTMSQLQFVHHPDAQVTFEFQNRNAGKPGGRLLDHLSVPELQARLDRFQAGFNDNEIDYLAGLERVDGSGRMFGRPTSTICGAVSCRRCTWARPTAICRCPPPATGRWSRSGRPWC